MKKLIIAFCTTVIVVCANAATTKWAITTGAGTLYTAGTTTALAGNYTAYVFCSQTADTATTATILTQSGLLTALRGGSDISTLGAQTTVAVSDGKIAQTYFNSDDFASGKSTKMYFAVIVDNDVFISGTSTKTSNATTAQTLSINPATASQSALKDINTAWGSAGWYTFAASPAPISPEPTSGVLMLLGMAGLALRRRRA